MCVLTLSANTPREQNIQVHWFCELFNFNNNWFHEILC